jgi:hypothetical protein
MGRKKGAWEGAREKSKVHGKVQGKKARCMGRCKGKKQGAWVGNKVQEGCEVKEIAQALKTLSASIWKRGHMSNAQMRTHIHTHTNTHPHPNKHSHTATPTHIETLSPLKREKGNGWESGGTQNVVCKM